MRMLCLARPVWKYLFRPRTGALPAFVRVANQYQPGAYLISPLILHSNNMKRTVHFKNGTRLEISQEVANLLAKAISAGSPQWQVFTDQHGNSFIFINLNEVTYID